MIALPDEAVAVVLSLHVPPANIAAFDRVLRELIDAARRKGRISGEVLRGPTGPSGRVYHVIYRFADEQSLRAWETSPERRALAARAESLATRAARNQLTGMEAWFDIPSGLSTPSRQRMAALTWIGIWPLVSITLWLVAPLYAKLPFLLRTALTSVLLVCAMTYVVMPLLARKAEPWLYGSSAPDRELRQGEGQG
ncbi:MAG TPA: antibiotic biosynthesis monooxygenase [Xanthobacteraceae bacterium]|nr:antibiotic biosynthesis monooxygenase [Xanthobacteraceae bacterium]